MAGALAVELLVSLLHHPKGVYAPPSTHKDQVKDNEFGLVPHQIRGELARFETVQLHGYAYDQCTACSESVL